VPVGWPKPFWSTAHQPTLKEADSYEVIYSQGRAEFRRRDDDIETHVEIGVSPEDEIELRRVSITNRGKMPRTIEVVLAPSAADAAHPAFSNLFVHRARLQGEAVQPVQTQDLASDLQRRLRQEGDRHASVLARVDLERQQERVLAGRIGNPLELHNDIGVVVIHPHSLPPTRRRW
jgi:hypothetical protein